MSQPQPPSGPNQQPNFQAPYGSQPPYTQPQYGQPPYGQTQPGMSAQMPGVPMQQPQSAPGNKNRRVLSIVIAVLVVAVVGIVIGVSSLNRPTPAAEASTGECIQDPEKKSSVYVTDCDADDAAYKVTAPDGSDCTTVAGTTTLYEGLCIIGVDEDPSTSLAGVKEGDCLNIDATTEDATTAECSSSTYTVLKVLTDVNNMDINVLPGNEDACIAAGVDEDAYTSWYKWNFYYFRSSSSTDALNNSTNDLVFCLSDPQS